MGRKWSSHTKEAWLIALQIATDCLKKLHITFGIRNLRSSKILRVYVYLKVLYAWENRLLHVLQTCRGQGRISYFMILYVHI